MVSKGQQPRVAIVGGAVAGLEIASTLGQQWRRQRGKNHQVPTITLIDRASAQVWKPTLHTIAAGMRYISQQQTPCLAQPHDAGFTYEPGEVVQPGPYRGRSAYRPAACAGRPAAGTREASGL
jgi:NADH dehydrogenase